MNSITIIIAIVGLIIGILSGSAGYKTIKSTLVSICIIFGFLGFVFYAIQINYKIEKTQKIYTSTVFSEIPGYTVMLSEPMRITVSTTQKPFYSEITYNIDTIKK